jgi:hypothetical protein
MTGVPLDELRPDRAGLTMHAVLAEALRCCSYRHSRPGSSSGFSLAGYYLFRYLWDHFHWWSLAMYGGFAVVAGLVRPVCSVLRTGSG